MVNKSTWKGRSFTYQPRRFGSRKRKTRLQRMCWYCCTVFISHHTATPKQSPTLLQYGARGQSRTLGWWVTWWWEANQFRDARLATNCTLPSHTPAGALVSTPAPAKLKRIQIYMQNCNKCTTRGITLNDLLGLLLTGNIQLEVGTECVKRNNLTSARVKQWQNSTSNIYSEHRFVGSEIDNAVLI